MGSLEPAGFPQTQLVTFISVKSTSSEIVTVRAMLAMRTARTETPTETDVLPAAGIA